MLRGRNSSHSVSLGLRPVAQPLRNLIFLGRGNPPVVALPRLSKPLKREQKGGGKTILKWVLISRSLRRFGLSLHLIPIFLVLAETYY